METLPPATVHVGVSALFPGEKTFPSATSTFPRLTTMRTWSIRQSLPTDNSDLFQTQTSTPVRVVPAAMTTVLPESIWKEQSPTQAPGSTINFDFPWIRTTVFRTCASFGTRYSAPPPNETSLPERSNRRRKKRLNLPKLIVGDKAAETLAVDLAGSEEIATLNIQGADIVNPVHDVVSTIRRIFINSLSFQGSHFDIDLLDVYSDFNQKIFCCQSKLNQSGRWPADTPLNFALSTDDELLGDHHPLLDLFPHHDKVVWKDNSGHVFLKFEELQADIEQSLGTETASAQ